jgi:hypothetical protein
VTRGGRKRHGVKFADAMQRLDRHLRGAAGQPAETPDLAITHE